MQPSVSDPEHWYNYSSTLPTIGEAWIRTCSQPGNPIVIRDTFGTELSSMHALTGSIILAQHISKLSLEHNVGILLPSSSASILSNLACMLLGKTVVNLNFTASTASLNSAIAQASIKTIYTSAKFLERLQARGFDVENLKTKNKVILLEDLKAKTSTLRKIYTLLSCRLLSADSLLKRYCKPGDPQQTATILFSSGSEGEPKGVLLSHQNIMANVKQTALLFNFSEHDNVLANLPPFHAFGLTATYFLPLLSRTPIVCHADPTDVVSSTWAIEKFKVSVMFGTSSFYRLYVRNPKVKPEQLKSLNFVIAGAEKLQAEVKDGFKLKFGIDIYEGYGATETSPVASCNLPEAKRPAYLATGNISKLGSVGLPLPGTTFRIADPDKLQLLPTGTAGMILISGPQVMLSYLDDPDRTNEVIRMIDGERCYISGDKGYLDEEGFLFIEDRYSRFAKIGGEMVGLGSLEADIRKVVDQEDFEVLVVSLPDKRKGEKLIALSTSPLDAKLMRVNLIAAGLSSLALPAAWFQVAEIPKLGTGKTDFATAKALAAELLESSEHKK